MTTHRSRSRLLFGLRWPALAFVAAVEFLVAISGLALWAVVIDERPITGREILETLRSQDVLNFALPWFGVILAAQCVLLLPVRRPAARVERGVSLTMSLVVAAMGMALLAAGLVYVLLELAGVWWPMVDHTQWGGWAIVAVPLVAWLVFTPLLLAFSRRHNRDGVLARVASALFLGSIVEALAVIPLDVMIRRRTDCYCAESTFFTLLICGTVGIFAFGPALFLVLLARRRKRWWAGKCEWCAYDMTGSTDADRCPECGAGWRA